MQDIKDNELKFVQNENENHIYIIQGAVEVQNQAYFIFSLRRAVPRCADGRERACVFFSAETGGGVFVLPSHKLIRSPDFLR